MSKSVNSFCRPPGHGSLLQEGKEGARRTPVTDTKQEEVERCGMLASATRPVSKRGESWTLGLKPED